MLSVITTVRCGEMRMRQKTCPGLQPLDRYVELSQLGMMPPVPAQSAQPVSGDTHPEVKAKARLEFEGSPSIVSSSWTSLTSAFSDRQPLAD